MNTIYIQSITNDPGDNPINQMNSSMISGFEPYNYDEECTEPEPAKVDNNGGSRQKLKPEAFKLRLGVDQFYKLYKQGERPPEPKSPVLTDGSNPGNRRKSVVRFGRGPQNSLAKIASPDRRQSVIDYNSYPPIKKGSAGIDSEAISENNSDYENDNVREQQRKWLPYRIPDDPDKDIFKEINAKMHKQLAEFLEFKKHSKHLSRLARMSNKIKGQNDEDSDEEAARK